MPRFLIRYPAAAVVLLTFGYGVDWLEWTGLGLELAVIIASVGTYAGLRQRSLSDIVTRTRVAVVMAPEALESGQPAVRVRMK